MAGNLRHGRLPVPPCRHEKRSVVIAEIPRATSKHWSPVNDSRLARRSERGSIQANAKKKSVRGTTRMQSARASGSQRLTAARNRAGSTQIVYGIP